MENNIEEYEVWDENYHGDTSEVVFSGTFEECERYIEQNPTKNLTIIEIKGPFTNHEILDRSFLVADMFDRYVAEHVGLNRHPDLQKKARELSDKLNDFYQEVGKRFLK